MKLSVRDGQQLTFLLLSLWPIKNNYIQKKSFFIVLRSIYSVWQLNIQSITYPKKERRTCENTSRNFVG